MKPFHQLATVQNILNTYKEDQPLHRFLPQFYRKNKQMGSKDRRVASRLVYNYYRLGDALSAEGLETKLVVAEFLCNQSESSLVSHYKPEWANKILQSVVQKIKLVTEEYPDFKLEDIFPFHSHLSDGINKEAFIQSHFNQPDLFIRVRKDKMHLVLKELDGADVGYKRLEGNTISFPNGTKLDQIISDKGLYEVQDLSSQQTGKLFKPEKWEKWWDCCAASGGKSLMLLDEEPTIKLLVSDVRESILANLDERFNLVGIKNYQKKVLDLTLSQALLLSHYSFDGIILDAPCSGSGTWGRTPEMLSQFKEHSITFFQELQRKIVTNAIPYLNSGKPLIYITCSVFAEENEDQARWIAEQFNFTIEHQELIKGYENKADSMFVARLIKK